MSDYTTLGLERWRQRTDGALLAVAIGSLPILALELARDELPIGDRRFLDAVNLLVLFAFATDYLVGASPSEAGATSMASGPAS